MRSLPVGWTYEALSDVCEVVQGQSPPGSTYNFTGEGLPFFQGKAEFGDMVPTTRKWCTSPKKVAMPGDVLISVRAPVGPTNLCIEPAAIGRGLAALRPSPDMPTKYLLYALRSSVKNLARQSTGTTFEAISGKTLREHSIPVAPPGQREAVVNEIERQFTRLDTGVGVLHQIRTRLFRYQASVLRSAIELGLKRGSQDAELASVSSSRLGKMLSAASRTGTNPKPYLRNINIRWDRIDTNDLLVMDFEPKELDEFALRRGDVLVCEGGEPGRSAVWEEQAPGALFQKALHRVRVDKDELRPKYLVFHLWADALTGRLNTYFTGSTIKHFTGVSLKRYVIRYPSLSAQDQVIDSVEKALTNIESLVAESTAALSRAENLRRSILAKAFSGELLTSTSVSC